MRKPVLAICEQQRGRSACVDISAFVFHCLDSIIPLVSISEMSSLYLVSVTAQTGSVTDQTSLPWLQTPKTGFLVMTLILFKLSC